MIAGIAAALAVGGGAIAFVATRSGDDTDVRDDDRDRESGRDDESDEGSDDGSEDSGTATTAARTTAAPTTTPRTTAAPTTAPRTSVAPRTTAPSGPEPGTMRITIDLHPDAVWDDGTPITAADFECTWLANAYTPGSISSGTYASVTDVHEGNGPRQVVVELSSVLAVYTGLFDAIFPRSAVADCFDVSDEFSDHLPSGGPWVLESWDSAGSVFVRNPEYWGEPAVAPRFVMRAIPDVDAEAAALATGEVDFVYPQFFTGIEDLFAEPDTSIVRAAAPDFEGLYFQQAFGPLADPVFRKALALSIDREALFTEIYAPRGGDTILQCGPIVPGPFCGDAFADLTYDPAGAVAALTADGWILNAAGLWERDGVVPQVRWMINSGNVRREDAQAYLIPRLRAAGFDVVPDNCDATCVFQQRLPALDYDIAMYISTAPPDPAYLGSAFSCGASDNVQGWCDEAATRALIEADVTLDPAERAALVKSALEAMSNPDNLVMLPLYQFPRTAAYRTDRVGPPDVVEAELANYHAFANFWQWEDLDGDGEIVLGAEQWPICLNPVTECSNSSWMIWTTAYPLLPGVWRTTADGRFRTTDLVVGVPLVEVG